MMSDDLAPYDESQKRNYPNTMKGYSAILQNQEKRKHYVNELEELAANAPGPADFIGCLLAWNGLPLSQLDRYLKSYTKIPFVHEQVTNSARRNVGFAYPYGDDEKQILITVTTNPLTVKAVWAEKYQNTDLVPPNTIELSNPDALSNTTDERLLLGALMFNSVHW